MKTAADAVLQVLSPPFFAAGFQPASVTLPGGPDRDIHQVSDHGRAFPKIKKPEANFHAAFRQPAIPADVGRVCRMKLFLDEFRALQ